VKFGSRVWKNATIAWDTESDCFSSRFQIASWMGSGALSLGPAGAQART
jgi:hypothetical protein